MSENNWWAERAKAAAERRDGSRPAPRPAAPDPEPSHDDLRRRFFSKTDRAAEPEQARVNPFLPPEQAPRHVDDEGTEERGECLAAGLGYVAGVADPPLAPAPMRPALDLPAAWPSTTGTPGPQGTLVQVVGLHGGAGASSVAALLGAQARDCGTSLENLVSVDVPILAVARTHAQGLDLALRFGQQFASRTLGPLLVLGVVLVRDAPTLSKGLARTVKSVQKGSPMGCWTVPWDEDLRHDPQVPAAARGPMGGDVKRILKKATQMRETHATHTERYDA